MNYYVIGDEDAVTGFSLVGVQGRVAANRDQAAAAFKEAIADHEIGIILITENVADLMRDTVDRYMFTEQFPLIVEIPDRHGPHPDRLPLKETVNRAIGISL